jgi:hypothetical protein
MTGGTPDAGTTGWSAGVVPVHQTDWDGATPGEVLSPTSNHQTCDYCHGWNDTDYDNSWGGTPPAHGDGFITLNSASAWNCAAACHTGVNNAGHNLADSGWPVNYEDFGSGDCDQCHASNNRDHLNTGESSAVHNTTHSSSSPYIADCASCHTHDGSVSPGTGDHGTGTVNFGTNLSSGEMDTTADTVVPTCLTTNSCHDADDTNEWSANDLGGDSCADCHAEGYIVDQFDAELSAVQYPPISGRHTTHLASDTLIPGDCNDCHGAGAVTGAHTLHKDGDIDYASTLTSYAGNDTCVNTCHLVTDDAGDWVTGSQSCSDCHADGYIVDLYDDEVGPVAYPPTSGMHNTHRLNTALVSGDCDDCHGAGAVTGVHTGHMDAAITYTTDLTSYSFGDGSCTNVCHTAGDWNDGTPAPACGDCHADGYIVDEYDLELTNVAYPPISGMHVTHNGAPATYVDDCNDCHGADATAGDHALHMNAAINYAAELTSYTPAGGTCTNTCHTVGDWRDGSTAQHAGNRSARGERELSRRGGPRQHLR